MARLRIWIGASAADAGVRLAAQMLSTVVVARLLAPEQFGLALMVLSVVAVATAFVGRPFEEALAQRRRLLTTHLEVALFVSLVLTGVSIALALALGPGLARLAGLPEIAPLLPAASLFLVAEGPGVIVRALARRYGRYVELGFCQSASVIVASLVAIWAATAGLGVWALILQRMLPNLLFPLMALAVARRRDRVLLIRPRWHAARFGEIVRFSWLNLADVGVGAATGAAMSFVVNALFGTAVLGQVNIAMRLVEPLRLLIGGVGHNIVFSLLARMQTEPERLGRGAAEAVANVSSLAVPAFFGIAVSAPILLPLLAGPGWEEAVPLSQALCLAAAISVPFGFLYTGFSALGRPEIGVAGACLNLAVLMVGLQLAQGLPPASGIGGALVAASAAESGLAIALLLRVAGRGAGAALGRTARVWLASGLMVGLLWLLYPLGPRPLTVSLPLLAAVVATGLVAYPILLLLLCRHCFQSLQATLLPSKSRT